MKIPAWLSFRRYPLLLSVVLVALVVLVLDMLNQRFLLNDFRVYWLASGSLRSGGEIYGISWGLDQAYFKYAPSALYPFIPLSFLPFKAAALIYYLVITGMLVLAFRGTLALVEVFFPQLPKRSGNLLIAAALLFIANAVYRELHLGNINFILLTALIFTLLLLAKGRDFAAGLLFGLAALFKPYLLFLLVVPFLHRRWRMLAGVVALVIVSLLIQLPIIGFSGLVELHTQWFRTMQQHSEAYSTVNSIPAVLNIHFGIQITPLLRFGVIFLGAMLIAAIDLLLQRKAARKSGNRQGNRIKALIISWFGALALLPVLVNTDTQLFMLSFPLMMLGTAVILANRSIFQGCILFIIFLFFGLNANDVVGDTIGNFLDATGAVGISNIALFIFCMILLFSHSDRELPAKEA